MSVFYQSIFVCRENTDTVFLLWFSLRTDIKCSIVLEKNIYFRSDKAMGMQVDDQLWYIKTTTSTVPNFHSNYWYGAADQQNCAICTKYLKDSMPGHQNLSRGSNHVPWCIKRQGARIKKNASTTSQNYLHLFYTLSVFTLMEIVYVRSFPVYVRPFPTSSVFARIWATCVFA